MTNPLVDLHNSTTNSSGSLTYGDRAEVKLFASFREVATKPELLAAFLSKTLQLHVMNTRYAEIRHASRNILTVIVLFSMLRTDALRTPPADSPSFSFSLMPFFHMKRSLVSALKVKNHGFEETCVALAIDILAMEVLLIFGYCLC